MKSLGKYMTKFIIFSVAASRKHNLARLLPSLSVAAAGRPWIELARRSNA